MISLSSCRELRHALPSKDLTEILFRGAGGRFGMAARGNGIININPQ